MNIKIKLHPNSSHEKIEKLSENYYHVWIKERPFNDKANKGLKKFLKNYFRKEIKIIKGLKSRDKIVEIK